MFLVQQLKFFCWTNLNEVKLTLTHGFMDIKYYTLSDCSQFSRNSLQSVWNLVDTTVNYYCDIRTCFFQILEMEIPLYLVYH